MPTSRPEPPSRSLATDRSIATDEYEGISTFPLAPLLSLLFFAAALGSRYLVGVVPPELRPLPRPFLSALATPALSLLGLLLALVGMRSPQSRGTARLGLALNGVVLGLSLLAILAFFAIYPEPLRPLGR